MGAIEKSQLSQLLTARSAENGQSSQVQAVSVQDQYLNLALQIQHNLEFQHRWTGLQLHLESPLTGQTLERPLLSGMPPRRLYVNPDEQVDLIRRETEARKLNKAAIVDTENATRTIDDEFVPKPELEWVLPAHLREEWSLSRFGALFDSIGAVPPSKDDDASIGEAAIKWRQIKRALLATVQDDSTIVYYFVHDGIVKPRQN